MHILKEKVQKSINRTTNGSTPTSIPGGISVLNPVPRTLYGGRQNSNEAEQLLQEVIEQQASKEQELVEENEQLRRTLYTVHVEIEGLLRKHSDTMNAPMVRLTQSPFVATENNRYSGDKKNLYFSNGIYYHATVESLRSAVRDGQGQD